MWGHLRKSKNRKDSVVYSFHLNSSVKTTLQVTLLSTKKVVIVQIKYFHH